MVLCGLPGAIYQGQNRPTESRPEQHERESLRRKLVPLAACLAGLNFRSGFYMSRKMMPAERFYRYFVLDVHWRWHVALSLSASSSLANGVLSAVTWRLPCYTTLLGEAPEYFAALLFSPLHCIWPRVSLVETGAGVCRSQKQQFFALLRLSLAGR